MFVAQYYGMTKFLYRGMAMSKKLKKKNFKKNITKVKELVKGTPELKQIDPHGIIDKIPPEMFDEVQKIISDTMGGDGLAKHISEFLGLFKVLSENIELNTAGIGALANNSIHFNNLLIEVKEKLKNIEQNNIQLNDKLKNINQHIGELKVYTQEL